MKFGSMFYLREVQTCRTGQSYDVIVAPVGSLGRGCGKGAPSVAEQPFVIEICNFGHICTVT